MAFFERFYLTVSQFTKTAIALKTNSCGVHSSEELGVRTDVSQLVLRQAAQIFRTNPLFLEKSPESKVELRVSIVLLAIDLLTALGR
jgi:hypothetical protein